MQHATRQDLLRQLAGSHGGQVGGEEAIHGRTLQVRLAKTKAHGSDPYPTYSLAGASICYPFVFCDATFTEAQGLQTPTVTDRQAAATKYFQNLAAGPLSYVPESTVLPVIYYRQRWWAFFLRPGSRLLMAQTDGAVAKTDASFTADTLTAMDGQTAPAGSVTVSNWAKWDAADNTKVMIAYDEAAAGWKFVQGPCKGD